MPCARKRGNLTLLASSHLQTALVQTMGELLNSSLRCSTLPAGSARAGNAGKFSARAICWSVCAKKGLISKLEFQVPILAEQVIERSIFPGTQTPPLARIGFMRTVYTVQQGDQERHVWVCAVRQETLALRALRQVRGLRPQVWRAWAHPASCWLAGGCEGVLVRDPGLHAYALMRKLFCKSVFRDKAQVPLICRRLYCDSGFSHSCWAVVNYYLGMGWQGGGHENVSVPNCTCVDPKQ